MQRRCIIRLAISILTGLLLALIVLRWMFWSAPGWYDPPDDTDADAAALAEQVEQRLAEEFHLIRSDEQTWTLRIRDHQVNAWLALRLPKWVERETGRGWPQRIGRVQVRFQPGVVQLCLPVQDGGRTRYLVAGVAFMLNQESEVTASVARLAHGRLPMPGDPNDRINAILRDNLPDALREEDAIAPLLELLLHGSINQPRITLQDGRVVEVLSLQLERGILDITARTRPANE